MEKSLLVVDCQNDFIRGSLACKNGEEAIEEIVSFINENKEIGVFYSLDWHSKKNKSFVENGGIWPIHCVKNTEGADLDRKFYKNIVNKNQIPLKEENIFFKGQDDEIEEYSACNAINNHKKRLNGVLSKEVVVCGIACEFCVKETVKDLIKNGFHVSVYAKGIAYVEEKGHKEAIEEMKKLGAKII